MRRGFEVAVGFIDNKEIDFVATKGKDRVYIQVSQTVVDENTAVREYASLLLLKDAYPKYVMTLDEIDLSYQGIRHMNIKDFLRGEEI